MIANKMSIFGFQGDKDKVIQGLNASNFTEIMAAEAESVGFVPVIGQHGSNALTFEANESLVLFKLRIDTKKVPPSAVNNEVKKRAEEIENREGYKPGRKQLREIKEQVQDEMILKALAQTVLIDGWFDFNNMLLVITESSGSKCDRVHGALLKAVDGLKPRFLRSAHNPSNIMTLWISGADEPPETITVDDKAKFAFPEGGKASLSALNLTDERIAQLTSMGGKVVELGITIKDRWSVVVTEMLVVKKITHVDIESEFGEASEEAWMAEATINADSAQKVHDALIDAFGGYMPKSQDDEESAPVPSDSSMESEMQAA